MPHEQMQVVAGREFWLGRLHGRPVVAVLSRIGKVAAATTATALVERFGVRRIVFTGVAGGLAPGVNVGDLVAAEAFLQHEAAHRGLVVSGDRFVSTTAESQALLRELPQALAVEMEGAAIAQVCRDHPRIP
ncbi:MAG: 5'-methylthioadenosine/adenosylhomocysteine nucleosidase, partial [Pseudomonadota bacterium]|nr:5'-methylthioadenosine/adenosylhomocysteine nucleosidase [Pseudomonadota bacterium]